MDFFIHSLADVQTKKIGNDTRIWQFCVVLPKAIIGSNCNICAHVLIENDVVIGNNVTIKSGVQLWDGITIADSVFIGPNVAFTNDMFPRSKSYPEKFLTTEVLEGVSIGANATILPGIMIGKNAMIGAGAVVTKNVPANAIVVGNPAYITGYSEATKLDYNVTSKNKSKHISDIKGVKIINIPVVSDLRGDLSFAEINQHLPFPPKRYFTVYNVQNKEIRGEHAHKTLSQFLVCIRGLCSVMLDNGKLKEEYLLDSPGTGILIPPMVWGVQYKYSSDAVLLVLASDVYDENDYIRDYDQFILAVTKG